MNAGAKMLKRRIRGLSAAERLDPGRPRRVEIGAGREAAVELEDRHAVGKRPQRARRIGVAADGLDDRGVISR